MEEAVVGDHCFKAPQPERLHVRPKSIGKIDPVTNDRKDVQTCVKQSTE